MTEEQRLILAHVVIDPDAWLAHAVAVRGEEQAQIDLAEKVERWRGDYEAAMAAGNYQNRAQREPSL